MLLQVLLIPLVASAVIFVARRRAARQAGWIAAMALLYTTCVSLFVTVEVHRIGSIAEDYFVIAPGIRLGLLADGLSAPTLSVVLLLCTALAFYSIRYVEHRVEILYYSENELTQASYYARFFYLLPFFPVGFIGTILSTNLVAMYFFMEVLTVTLFFLMAYFGYQERVRVAFVSLTWGIIGALIFLVASLVVYSQTGSFEIAELSRLAGTPVVTGTILLFVVSLMMKLAVVPLHVWMPSSMRSTRPASLGCSRCMPTSPSTS